MAIGSLPTHRIIPPHVSTMSLHHREPLDVVLRVGDLRRGKLLYEWLADEDNRELVDAIERVNGHMLDQLIGGSDSLAVLFCKYHGFLHLIFHARNHFDSC